MDPLQKLSPIRYSYKLGPCIIFQCEDGSLEKPLVATVDLVSTFPLKGKSVLELYNIVIKTLVQNQPPEWLPYFYSILRRDIILPESFASQTMETVNAEGDIVVNVAIKLLSYGPANNYIIRPAQEMEIQEFQEMQQLKKVYIYLKALKALLKVSGAKSYFMKKVLLLPEFKKRANDPNVKVDELLCDALSHPDLSVIFKPYVNLKYWKVQIDQRKEYYEDNFIIPLMNNAYVEG